MTEVEVAKLLAMISAIDSRVVSEPMIKMWTQVLNEHRPGERPWTAGEAWEAVPRYFATNDAYLMPRGLIVEMKRVREAQAEVEHHDAITDGDGGTYAPMPKCARHGLGIIHCSDCCALISKRGKEYPLEDLHAWAMANVYEMAVA